MIIVLEATCDPLSHLFRKLCRSACGYMRSAVWVTKHMPCRWGRMHRNVAWVGKGIGCCVEVCKQSYTGREGCAGVCERCCASYGGHIGVCKWPVRLGWLCCYGRLTQATCHLFSWLIHWFVGSCQGALKMWITWLWLASSAEAEAAWQHVVLKQSLSFSPTHLTGLQLWRKAVIGSTMYTI